METKDIEEGKSVAWLSYISLLFLVPLLSQKNNSYTKFHIKQGIVLFITSIIVGFVDRIFILIPVVGYIFMLASSLVLLILMIIGIVNALSGKTESLPVIGKFAEKINI